LRGRKTSTEKAEEIKALSLIYTPQTISEKLQVPLRTCYAILAKRDNPAIETRREEKRLQVVDKVWADKEGEILKIKSKMEMILDGLDQEKVNRARLTELSTSFGILFDKRQLLTGAPTENINALTAIVEAAHAKPEPKRAEKESENDASRTK